MLFNHIFGNWLQNGSQLINFAESLLNGAICRFHNFVANAHSNVNALSNFVKSMNLCKISDLHSH